MIGTFARSIVVHCVPGWVWLFQRCEAATLLNQPAGSPASHYALWLRRPTHVARSVVVTCNKLLAFESWSTRSLHGNRNRSSSRQGASCTNKRTSCLSAQIGDDASTKANSQFSVAENRNHLPTRFKKRSTRSKSCTQLCSTRTNSRSTSACLKNPTARSTALSTALLISTARRGAPQRSSCSGTLLWHRCRLLHVLCNVSCRSSSIYQLNLQRCRNQSLASSCRVECTARWCSTACSRSWLTLAMSVLAGSTRWRRCWARWRRQRTLWQRFARIRICLRCSLCSRRCMIRSCAANCAPSRRCTMKPAATRKPSCRSAAWCLLTPRCLAASRPPSQVMRMIARARCVSCDSSAAASHPTTKPAACGCGRFAARCRVFSRVEDSTLLLVCFVPCLGFKWTCLQNCACVVRHSCHCNLTATMPSVSLQAVNACPAHDRAPQPTIIATGPLLCMHIERHEHALWWFGCVSRPARVYGTVCLFLMPGPRSVPVWTRRGGVSCNYRCALSVVLTLSFNLRGARSLLCLCFGHWRTGIFRLLTPAFAPGQDRCSLCSQSPHLASCSPQLRVGNAAPRDFPSEFCFLTQKLLRDPRTNCAATLLCCDRSDSPIREKHLWSFHSLDFRVPVDTMVVMLSYVRSSVLMYWRSLKRFRARTGTGPCTVHVEDAHRNQRQPAYHNERGQRQSI